MIDMHSSYIRSEDLNLMAECSHLFVDSGLSCQGIEKDGLPTSACWQSLRSLLI